MYILYIWISFYLYNIWDRVGIIKKLDLEISRNLPFF